MNMLEDCKSYLGTIFLQLVNPQSLRFTILKEFAPRSLPDDFLVD